MGIITVSASKDETFPTSTFTARVINKQKLLEVLGKRQRSANCSIYKSSTKSSSISNVQYKPVLELQHPYTLPSEMHSDLLWHFGWIFSTLKPRPNWSGFMQHIFCDNQNSVSKSKILYLPIIDLNPSDKIYIFSKLFVLPKPSKGIEYTNPMYNF